MKHLYKPDCYIRLKETKSNCKDMWIGKGQLQYPQADHS